MANDVNSVVLVGRLVRDCESKTLSTGTAVVRFSIAVNRYGGKDKDDEVSYFDIVAYGKMADMIAKFLEKGKQVCVQGELRQERWEKDGEKNSRVNIVADTIQLLGSPSGQCQQKTSEQHTQQATQPSRNKSPF